MLSRGNTVKACAGMIAAIGAIVAPAQAAEHSLTCKYVADYASTTPTQIVGSFNGGFSSLACVSIGDAGPRTLSLVPGSGKTTGIYTDFGLGIGMFVGNGTQVGLTDGQGFAQSFELFPAMSLQAGSGHFQANARHEPGFGTALGTATLTSCPAVAIATCGRRGRREGAFPLPWQGH